MSRWKVPVVCKENELFATSNFFGIEIEDDRTNRGLSINVICLAEPKLARLPGSDHAYG